MKKQTTKPASPDTFHTRAVRLIQRIPKGKVVTYGQVATLAGEPRGARQVVRILNSSWKTEKLPWHRVINRNGQISLPPGGGYELQKSLLEKENVVFGPDDTIDLGRFLWKPRK
ncbi:MAG: DNA methyltransferase [candidate division Zixibacteria bacterium]|nr:DNA methyltransferase [candidate division Zixibacteria bacterium]